MKHFYLLLLSFFIVGQLNAQNSCENLYTKAVQFQQTMTVASQNKAISYFQKAQSCYDSDAKKKLCASQIATCKNTIALINKKKSQDENPSEKVSVAQEDSIATIGNEKVQKGKSKATTLTVSESIVKFKAKGGEFKKVKVSCNYADWKVVEQPEWITYSVSKNNELVLEASKNPFDEDRSGMVKIECHGATASFAVMQTSKTVKKILNKIGL